MLHIWNNWRRRVPARVSTGVLCLLVCVAGASCSTGVRPGSVSSSYNQRSISEGGLAVGFVVNREGGPTLKGYERHLYADQLATYILGNNPQLKGRLDSYRYVSNRIGKPFASMINSYKLEGELNARSIDQLKNAQLRRRFLMLVSILQVDEVLQLPVDVEPASGLRNADVEDYEDVRYQTGRLKVVQVQVYDTKTGKKVQDQLISSDDGNILLAAERSGRRYTGNSLLAALANSVSSRIRHSGSGYPAAPSQAVTLNYLWERIAKSMPGALTS